MTPEELDELLDNPNFISGIYNYCDRWCERCPLTARCFQYAMENEQRTRRANRRQKEPPTPATPRRSDDDNADFWEEVEETFQTTFALLQQMMDEMGIDPNAISDEEHAKRAEQKRLLHEEVKRHTLAITSAAYIQQVNRWFAAAEGLFQEKGEALLAFVRMNVGEAEAEAEALAITDAVEVIRWYQYFIHVKLRRALSGLFDEKEEIEETDTLPSSRDISAKLALIAIDRSIGAWGRLLRAFPPRETETLELLVALDRLRRAVEQIFPTARAVVRPGFDTLSALED